MATGFTMLMGLCLAIAATKAMADLKPPASKLRPFKSGTIKLLPGRLKAAFDKNAEYLESLDSDMLLYAYRFFAYRKTPGRPCGGWEHPLNANKGTFLGHWLSAAAQTLSQSNDERLRKKAEDIIADLRETQRVYGNGWVQASGPERLWVLEGKHKGDPDFGVITAPYYVVHKLLAGLLDMYNLAGSKEALVVAKDFAAFIAKETKSLTDEHLQKILEREHGGMEEVMFNMAATTGDKSYYRLAKRFQHLAFTGPLAKHEDKLTDLHVNTQLPKLVGEARRWECLGEKDAGDLVEYAWDLISSTRSYATGGSSSQEHWRKPNELTPTLCTDTQESCTTYNWIKLTRHLLEWTGDAKYGDMIERAFVNGIMPAQNPHTGMFIYFLPLMKSGATKHWGSATEDFWCCYGTMVESFSTLADDAFFASDDSLAVNLYVPAKVEWNGVAVSEDTAFPESDRSTIKLAMGEDKKFELLLRIPGWTGADAKVEVDGAPVAEPLVPGTYLKIARTWRDGDVVTTTFPRRLHLAQLGNDPNTVAVMYGPVVLAAIGDKAPKIPAGDPSTWLRKTGEGLVFEGLGITFKPLCDVVDETYVAYFDRE